MMMILSPIGLIKSAGFESDFHYYDVTDLLFTVIPYFSHGLDRPWLYWIGIISKWGGGERRLAKGA